MQCIYLFFTVKEASVKYNYTSKFRFFVSTFVKKKKEKDTPFLFTQQSEMLRLETWNVQSLLAFLPESYSWFQISS